MRGTSGRRAGGGGLGVDDVASDGFSTQFERCTAQIRALLGALAVQLLHDVGEEASRGRRLAPRLVPLEGPGVMLFGAVNRSVGFVFSSTVAATYKRIEKVRVSVLETVKWRRAGFAEAAPRRARVRRPQRRRCRVVAGRVLLLSCPLMIFCWFCASLICNTIHNHRNL